MTTKSLQQALTNSKKAVKNGFTLIELMVVVAIVGVLSGVALPQLLKAQDTAKDSKALQVATNAAKTCSIAIISGVPADGDLAVDTDGTDGVTNDAITCAVDADFIVSGPKTIYTVELESGVPLPYTSAAVE